MPATTRCRNASLASSSARISAIRKLDEPNRYQRSYGSLRARSLRASSFSATRCGLNVTQASLQAVGDSDVLMLQRFDREHTGMGYLRFGLVSGLTVPDCDDSYLNRERWSDKPEADCAELFRRMVFNAAVTNNDDHPFNHALLRRPKRWRLSPPMI